jgi:hypothetical protein
MSGPVAAHERPHRDVGRSLKPLQSVGKTPANEDFAGLTAAAGLFDLIVQKFPRCANTVGHHDAGGLAQPKTFFAMTMRWIWFVPS